MSQKKVLIEEIFSQNVQNNQDDGSIIEEEQKPQQMNQQVISTKIQTENAKTAKKDLLRLEKNYFDNIYNQEKHQNEKQFAIQKILNQNAYSKVKPDFKALPKSSIKDRLAQFMPSFKKDTDDLLVNVERQEKMRIDDRNQYEIEQEEGQNGSSNSENDSEEEFEQQQEMDHMSHQQQIIELKKKNKEQIKEKKNKHKHHEEQDQNPKMIQLDLLLGILEQKNVDGNEENNNEDTDDNNNQMNIEQESTSQNNNNNNNTQNAKIQEIN